VYNISYGKTRKVSEFGDSLRELFPDLTIEIGPGLWANPMARGDQQENLARSPSQRPPLDITRAKNDFDYNPEWDIERAIPDWVRWLKEKGI
jgi:nucleoside-diphosphate-sugar epimerase